MAQQLRGLAALAEDLGSSLSTYLVLTAICSSSPRRTDAQVWPLMILHTNDVQAYMQAKPSIRVK